MILYNAEDKLPPKIGIKKENRVTKKIHNDHHYYFICITIGFSIHRLDKYESIIKYMCLAIQNNKQNGIQRRAIPQHMTLLFISKGKSKVSGVLWAWRGVNGDLHYVHFHYLEMLMAFRFCGTFTSVMIFLFFDNFL